MTTVETTPERSFSSLPASGSRCTDVFADVLRGYAGVKAVQYDYAEGQLRLVYDPEIISPAHALLLVNEAGKMAAGRTMECAARREMGGVACAICALQLGQALALDPSRVTFQGDVLQIRGMQTTQPVAEVEEIPAHPTSAASPALPRFDEQKIQILFTVLTALFTLTALLLERWGAPPMIGAGLFALAYLTGGWFGLLASLEALREKILNVDLLMILAALGAAIIGSPAEGAVLLFLFSLSNTLQAYAMDRSRKAIEKLLDLRPKVATVRRGSRLVTVPVERLIPGDIVIVRPGERFPIDGEVISGTSEVNQATITGESMPVSKQVGDAVFAGTVNGNGSLEVRVTRLAKDTTLARIVQMVEEAQANKAKTQRMLDTFERYYAFFVLGMAVLLIIVPYFVLGQPFYPTFYRAMTWLVVASPCALVISTPASILSAIANGARNGVLFKGGVHLEKAAALKVVAFDKTGTLTLGVPQLTGVYPLADLDEATLLQQVAAVEARSEHPIGAAIVRAAQERGLSLPSALEFRAYPGRGIEAQVSGRRWRIGNTRLFAEHNLPLPDSLQTQIRQLEDEGQTVILAYVEALDGPKARRGYFAGLLTVADALRPEATHIVQALKRVGIERVVMLTGDNERVAARIAAYTGVDAYYANLLPQDKVRVLRELRETYGLVAMVGDGVNDAPSLAVADLGIAMGGAGTDVAIETADVILMSDDLQKIPFAMGLARQARRVVWQNLAFALAMIVVLVSTTFGATLPLPLGVLGHEGSTVIVVLNGLRLLGYRGLSKAPFPPKVPSHLLRQFSS
ncbi:heavy metal translocating P-type ATPase [uncultured Thermanaerothrix sp.]|uniref:heavy metal translocating P-type ATPase n=1 Tax=uncultured Thermanaerothrix sp. TaxID=1195149 RepID=UPI00262F3AD3|nr:heavy metal translocating P-type ATPase [uncultured Thermanaerothrix sp.]